MPAIADFALAHDGDEALAQGLRETVRNFRRLVGLMGPLARAERNGIDVARAFAHFADAAGGHAGEPRRLRDGRVLFADRMTHAVEDRTHALNRLDDLRHRAGGCLGRVAQAVDPLTDVVRSLAGLGGENLHLARHNGEAPTGGACAGGLDGGVEREQIGLASHRGDRVHDPDDLGRGGGELRDEITGLLRRLDRVVDALARMLHRAADLGRRHGQFFRRRGEREGFLGCGPAGRGQLSGMGADIRQILLHGCHIRCRHRDRLGDTLYRFQNIGLQRVHDLGIEAVFARGWRGRFLRYEANDFVYLVDLRGAPQNTEHCRALVVYVVNLTSPEKVKEGEILGLLPPKVVNDRCETFSGERSAHAFVPTPNIP